MEYDKSHHRVSNYQNHIQLLNDACEWMDIDKGRAKQYQSLIKQFFEDDERSREHILAYNESCEITEIYELWKTQIDYFSGLERKIRLVFGKGSLLHEYENPANSSSRSRNDAFVYLLAGKLVKAGIKVVAVDGIVVDNSLLKSNADITLCHNQAVIDIQCKRPLRLNQIQKRIKEARKQLMESTSGNEAGIVGLDCSAVIRPIGTLIETGSAEDSVNYLGDLMERKIVPIIHKILDPVVVGFILFARSPAMTRKGQSAILSTDGVPYRRYFRPESISSSLIVPNPICSESGIIRKIFEMLNRSLGQE
ncbi:MAG TPA: hypothetical protein PKJ10_04265 [Smithella sp.]|nr:hypothetical protein [Smithella sp.]